MKRRTPPRRRRRRRLLPWLAVGAGAVLAALAAAAAGLVAWAERELERPLGSDHVELVVERGAPLASILDQLSAAEVIGDPLLARLYLDYRRPGDVLQAGEYRFEQPMSTVEVLDRVIRGDVVTYAVTVIEGLTLRETAEHLAAGGFGDLDAFLQAMSSPAPIADLDPAAESLEGYLFPDTYAFPRGTGEGEIVEAMVGNFRRRVADHLEAGAGHGLDPRGPRDAGEHRREGGRRDRGAPPGLGRLPQPAGARHWPLRRPDDHLRPEAGRHLGTATCAAVTSNSTRPTTPTSHPGLPPGPICSPGEHSLRAAARPADVPYLYFVSRNDGTHVFAETPRRAQPQRRPLAGPVLAGAALVRRVDHAPLSCRCAGLPSVRPMTGARTGSRVARTAPPGSWPASDESGYSLASSATTRTSCLSGSIRIGG